MRRAKCTYGIGVIRPFIQVHIQSLERDSRVLDFSLSIWKRSHLIPALNNPVCISSCSPGDAPNKMILLRSHLIPALKNLSRVCTQSTSWWCEEAAPGAWTCSMSLFELDSQCQGDIRFKTSLMLVFLSILLLLFCCSSSCRICCMYLLSMLLLWW